VRIVYHVHANAIKPSIVRVLISCPPRFGPCFLAIIAFVAMDDDEDLRKAIEASMHTAADEAQRNALPSAPPLVQHTEDSQVSSLSSYEQQRREAIARQQERWQTQHHHHHQQQQQQYHPSDPVDVPLAHYPPIPTAVHEVDRGMQHSVLEETEEERQVGLHWGLATDP